MSTALQDGTLFAGRYRVLRCIARGGMGAVYEVLHLETERRRALKVMLPHVFESDDLRERFRREAKVAAHIDSEFIVEVFDAGVDEATSMPFLVMELLRGEELGKRLKRLGRFAPADVIAYLHQTALALDKTHQASIVHRDLKPENLFLTDREDGPPRVKVLDFGVAKVVAETASAGATQSIGTPLYMAPEQFNPRAHLTGAADRYALGMVAYTLLVGAAYWADEARGGNVFALAAVAIRGPYEPASVRAAQRGVALPRAFDAWFARATAADPGARFPTSSETVRALAESLGLPPPGRAPEASQVSLAGLVPLGGPALSAPVPVSGTIPVTASALITTAAPSAPPRKSRTGLLVGVGLGAFVIMAAVVGVLVHFVGSPPTPVAAVAVAAPPEPVASVRAEPAPTAAIAPVPVPTVAVVAPTASVSATAAPAHLVAPTARPTVKPRPVAGAPIYSRE